MQTHAHDVALLASLLEIDPKDVDAFARRLSAVGGLHGLWLAGSEALEAHLDEAARRRLDEILAMVGRILAPCELPLEIVDAASVTRYFRPWLATRPTESFWILALDARLKPLACVPIAEGTLTSCIVHPREVFAAAVRARAASIIAVHNHPSGDPEPSDADEVLTDRLTEAGAILGIPLVDHVIVARRGFRSLGRPQTAAGCDSSRPNYASGGAHTWKA
jgi:DNA repair protein RadC